jgi:hypothetical protein
VYAVTSRPQNRAAVGFEAKFSFRDGAAPEKVSLLTSAVNLTQLSAWPINHNSSSTLIWISLFARRWNLVATLTSARLQQFTNHSAIVEPARCRAGGFEFSQEKLTKPSKCPEFHSTWILEPKIAIQTKNPAGERPST